MMHIAQKPCVTCGALPGEAHTCHQPHPACADCLTSTTSKVWAAECKKCGRKFETAPLSPRCDPKCGGEIAFACAMCGRTDNLHNAWCPTLKPGQTAVKSTPPKDPAPASTLRDALVSLAVAFALGLVIDHIDVPTAKALLQIAEDRERLRAGAN